MSRTMYTDFRTAIMNYQGEKKITDHRSGRMLCSEIKRVHVTVDTAGRPSSHR